MTPTPNAYPLLKLWQELRKRLLLWLTCLVLFSLALLPYANALFNLFARPLLNILHTNQPLIAIGILSGFWVPIERRNSRGPSRNHDRGMARRRAGRQCRARPRMHGGARLRAAGRPGRHCVPGSGGLEAGATAR